MRSRWFHYIEVITGLSVVVTLVVLIVEVRTNTHAIERQILLDRAANAAAPFVLGPELLEAYERIKEVDGWDPENQEFMERYRLEPRQAIAWTRFLLVNWSGLEADYLTSGPSGKLRSQIIGLMTFPDNRLFWEAAGSMFDPEFVAYVEQYVLVRPEPSG